MDRGEFLRTPVQQVHGQDRAQNQDIGQFGLRLQGQFQELRMGDVFPEEWRRHGQSDDVVPPHHHQRSQPFELGFDNHRIDGDRHHGHQHQRVAVGAAAVGEHEPVVEEQDGGADQGADDAHDPRPDVFVRVHQVVHDQRHGGTEGRDDRSVDGRGVGRSPQQHVHPAVDNQHRDDQDIARVAPADAERLLREEREGNEEHRRRKDLKHEYLLEVQIIARKGDIERKVRSEKEVGKYQIDIVTRFAHGNSKGQLLHQILPIFAASIPQ